MGIRHGNGFRCGHSHGELADWNCLEPRRGSAQANALAISSGLGRQSRRWEAMVELDPQCGFGFCGTPHSAKWQLAWAGEHDRAESSNECVFHADTGRRLEAP